MNYWWWCIRKRQWQHLPTFTYNTRNFLQISRSNSGTCQGTNFMAYCLSCSLPYTLDTTVGLEILTCFVIPVNPGRQWQVNPFTRSTHVPPCWQGSEIHSLMFVLQRKPAKAIKELKMHRKEVRHRRRSPICSVCWSIHCFLVCMLKVSLAYTRLIVHFTYLLTTASNCNIHLGCFVLFPGFSSHRTREYMKNNTRLQGCQSPLNTIRTPLFQLGGLGSAVSSRSQWWIQDFWKEVWRVPEGHEVVDEGRGVPSLGWGPRRGCAPCQKIFEI